MELQQRFDEYLIEQDRLDKLKRKSGVISPSSLCQCYRRQFWTRQGIEPSNPLDIETLRVFAIGKHLHQTIQMAFDNAQAEVEVTINSDVYGHADLVFDDEVVDIKSCGTWQFKKFEKMTAEQFAEEKPDYVLQVIAYAMGLKKGVGRVALVSKETGAILSFAFLTNVFRGRVEAELSALRGFWFGGELPPAKPVLYRQKDGTFKECEYCQFRDKCEILEGKKVF